MRAFADGASEPANSLLETELGPTWAAMQSVLELAKTFRREWNFTNGSGWMLKVHDGQKALFYLIPLRGAFTITMALRDKEHEVLLARGGFGDEVQEQLASARKHAEGYAVKFDIWAPEDLGSIEPFLRELIRIRREGTTS